MSGDASAIAIKQAGAACWIGAVGIGAVAVLRCLTSFTVDPVFGTDPILDPHPSSAVGPVGSMILDALLLLACAIGLLGEVKKKQGVSWLLFLLAFIPVPIVIWHGLNDAGNLWRGSTWVAATIACVTLGHLVRDRNIRIVLTASLIAVIAPLLMHGLVQVFIEHGEMVSQYRSDPSQHLSALGIEPGSNSARIFERRLNQPETTGWFGLANVFGTFMVFGIVVWVGFTYAAVKAKLSSGWWGAAGVVSIGCAVGLYYCGSKGAYATAGIGLILLLILISYSLSENIKEKINNSGGYIALGIVGSTLVGVFTRGLTVPEGFVGEKSVLFRWHYLQASFRILKDNLLMGVGPNGFQNAYVIYRNANSPEEVMSSHSIFFDWLTMLGLSGFALVLLVLIVLWIVGKHSILKNNNEVIDCEDSKSNGNYILPSVIVICALGMVPAFLFEQATLDERSILFRVVGLGLFIACGVLIGKLSVLCNTRILGITLAAGVIAMLAHCQIEMTLIQPGAVVWCMCALGLAWSCQGVSKQIKAGYFIAGLLIVLVASFVAFSIIPALNQQSKTQDIAYTLSEIGLERWELKVAGKTIPEISYQQELDARIKAVAELESAYELWRCNPVPLVNATAQAAIAASMLNDNEAVLFYEKAASIALKLTERWPAPASFSLLARVYEEQALRFGDSTALQKAITARNKLVDLDPHGLQTRLSLADLLYDAEKREDAAEVYYQVLKINEQLYLDELKQLDSEDLIRAQARSN